MNRKTLKLAAPLRPPVERLVESITAILDRGWLTNDGQVVRELEQTLANALDVERVLTTTNGTAALDLVLRGLVPPGEVILTGFSFPATYNVVLNNRDWAPRFVDIDAHFGLDPERVADAVGSDTRAILAVHPYGFPADVDGLRAVADAHALPLIFDAAPCFGVRYRGRSLAGYGDAAILSLHATKVFSSVEGGVVVTDDAALLEDVRLRRNFGIANEDEVRLFGLNAKLDELRAAFALAALPELPAALARRKDIAELYREGFATALAPLGFNPLATVERMYDDPDLEPNYAYFPLRLPEAIREPVFQTLRAHGVLARKYYHQSVTQCRVYAPYIERAELPNTIAASSQVLCLPLHQELDDEDVERVLYLTATAISNAVDAQASRAHG